MVLINWKKSRTVMAFSAIVSIGHIQPLGIFVFLSSQLLPTQVARHHHLRGRPYPPVNRSSFLFPLFSPLQPSPSTLCLKMCVTFLPDFSGILLFLPSNLLLSWLRDLTIEYFHSCVYFLFFTFKILLQSYSNPS